MMWGTNTSFSCVISLHECFSLVLGRSLLNVYWGIQP